MNDLETALGIIGDHGNTAESAANRFAQQAGELVDIAFMTIDSPIGDLILAATSRGLLRIGFDNESGVLEQLAERVSPRILEYPARLEESRRELDEYFAGKRERGEAVAYTPDGASLVTGGADKSVQLWTVANGAMPRAFAGNTDAVNSVAVSKDGTKVFSAGKDKKNRRKFWCDRAQKMPHDGGRVRREGKD